MNNSLLPEQDIASIILARIRIVSNVSAPDMVTESIGKSFCDCNHWGSASLSNRGVCHLLIAKLITADGEKIEILMWMVLILFIFIFIFS